VNSITNSMISNGHSLTFVILHRTLPTNTFLVKIGIKNSDLCNFCKNDTDSIPHYIWICPVVKLFWNRVKIWLEEIFYISFDKLLEFRIVLIKWLLYSAFAMLVTFLLLIMDIRLEYFKKLSLQLS
jgi:hypothetical protein